MKKISNYCSITTVSSTTDSFIIDFLKELKSQGVNVTIVCNMTDDFYNEYKNDFNCVNMPFPRGGLGIFETLHFIFKLYKFFRENNFDMIQYATPNAAFYSSIASFLSRDKKRVYCQWGIRYVGFTGYKRALFKLVEKITCYCSTHVRPASIKNMLFGVNETLYNREKTGVVGIGGTIGVDTSLFSIDKKDYYRESFRKLHGLKPDEFIFGFMGSVRKDKGVTELLIGFRSILELGVDAKLLIAGNRFEQDPIDDDVYNWALSSDLVIFLGRVDDTHIFMSSIDILVHPSYREGFSMVIQEAAFMKQPVITTKIDGASEVLVENESCLLVEPKNSEELAKAMYELYSDNALRNKLSLNAYDYARSNYRREIMIENICKDRLAIYEEIK